MNANNNVDPHKEFNELGAEVWFLKYTDPKEAQGHAEADWKWRLDRSDLSCLIRVEDWDDLENMAANPMSYVEGNTKLWDFLMDCCLVNWFRSFKSLVDAGVLSEEKFEDRYWECMKAVKPNNELVANWVKSAAEREMSEIEYNLD